MQNLALCCCRGRSAALFPVASSRRSLQPWPAKLNEVTRSIRSLHASASASTPSVDVRTPKRQSPSPTQTEPVRHASIWSRWRSEANLAQQREDLKKAVQANPSSVEANTAFISHLSQQIAQSNDKARAAKDAAELVDRYEAGTGLFVANAQPTALLRHQKAYDQYLTALVLCEDGSGVGAGDKLASAAQRRAALLAMPVSAASSPVATETATSPSTPLQTQPQLTSDQIATAVLSRGNTNNVKVAPPLIPPPSTSEGAAGSASSPNPSSTASSSSNSASSNSSGPSAYAGSAPIRVIVEEARGNIYLRAIRFLLMVLIYSFISLTILSLVLDGSGLMRASTSRAPTEFQPSTVAKPVSFKDVHGCEEAKAELQEVVDFLKDPAQFSNLGGRLPKGVLLTGPPGTGKTLLARAVAGEAGVAFLFASGSEFDELFVGVGAKRVRELFAAARKAAPCIIFIDELDAIGSKRSPRDAQHMRQTLNQLLTELDGFTQSEGVILLGATNLPNLLDKALTRPGRFDKHVAVPLPDVRGRLQILQHHAKNVRIMPGMDMIAVARGTPGFSGAQLENLINQAAVKASREGSKTVGLSHVEWAKDKILMGAERLSAVITPESRRKTAYHEAGHALVALYTDGAMPLHRVTVIPRGHSLGHTLQLPEMDRDSESFLELRARIDVAMGGRAAEEVIYGRDNITSGASSDIKGATDVANAMVRHYGFSDALGTVNLSEDEKISTDTLHLIESEVRSLVEGAQARAMMLLKTKSEELKRLAEALIVYESLNLDDVQRVVKGETPHRPVI